MIAGATRGSGGGALARHLMSRKGGQIVRVLDARHLVADDLRSQINELVVQAKRGRTDRAVHHVHIDPPPDADAERVMKKFVTHYEREFGLEGVQRCGVEHEKSGRKHYHLVYSLVNERGKVVSLAHEYARREKVSRITEYECGLPFVKGKHNRAVHQALLKGGRSDVAEAMEAAGLLNGRRPVAAQTPAERAQAERTAVPVETVRAAAYAAWQASDTGPAFTAALEERGLQLAAGRRGAVLVDAAGASHSLTRILSAAARSDGGRLTAAVVKRRISSIALKEKEDLEHDRRTHTGSAEEPAGGDLSGGQGSPPDESAAPASPESPGAAGGLGAAGRAEEPAVGHRPHTGTAVESPRPAQGPRRTGGADAVAVRRLAALDVAPLRARAESIQHAPARRAVRDRAAARQLARLDVVDLAAEARRLAAGGDQLHSQPTTTTEEAMKKSRRVSSAPELRPAHVQDYKARLLADALPGVSPAAFEDDIYMVKRKSGGAKIQMRDRSWLEVDEERQRVRTWGRPGRAADLAAEAARARGWTVEQQRPRAGTAIPEGVPYRPPGDLATWWREQGYDAIAARDGVWVSTGDGAQIQDTGNRMALHGELTPEAARAFVLKAKEQWSGEAKLQGAWSQSDHDMLWLEAQRAGVTLHRCTPSRSAQAAWETETAAAAERAKTLGQVREAAEPAQLLQRAAAGDAAAWGQLQRTEPELAYFVSDFLDDEQRKELANSDVADIVPELDRFRETGAQAAEEEAQHWKRAELESDAAEEDAEKREAEYLDNESMKYDN